MERRYRLQKNKSFQYVYHRGRSAACRDLVMLVAKGRGMKVGFSVSKKVGNSIVRHRLTRLIRESYRLNEELFPCGKDIVVIARAAAKGKGCREIESALLHLGRLHRMIQINQ